MLYHVPDLERGLSEIARVLRPDGALVAVTNGIRDLAELWELVGRDLEPRSSTFGAESGDAHSCRRFESRRRIDVVGPVFFPDGHAIRTYVGSSALGRELVSCIPDSGAPLVATRVVAVFVATEPRRSSAVAAKAS